MTPNLCGTWEPWEHSCGTFLTAVETRDRGWRQTQSWGQWRRVTSGTIQGRNQGHSSTNRGGLPQLHRQRWTAGTDLDSAVPATRAAEGNAQAGESHAPGELALRLPGGPWHGGRETSSCFGHCQSLCWALKGCAEGEQ